MVNLIVVRRLDAADGNTVVYSGLVNGGRERLLRELQLRGRNECHSIFLVRLAGVLEQLPDLLGPTRASFYIQTHNNQSSRQKKDGIWPPRAAIFNHRVKERLEIKTAFYGPTASYFDNQFLCMLEA